ncbi:nucleotidyltransferase family protein [Winogradskyella flava]|uniref:Nucleotidyltransferase family protein n=1 Tax=Winogradskyella flava TaxID=1884876 RepID=A0A842INW3_9FLAO|nr:nucleotidyltransferase family protein [Winogradskyella flava]MBC2844471.1 nucleotidyltransferase family protein [Winogradskyella flava]
MANLADTYHHIAHILSFETQNNILEKRLNRPGFNWDSIVKEASKHLVLPAIYCRLKARKLLHVLPDDLNTYLDEITTINRNRNKSIIKQVHTLSKLLNKHSIEHVFLKGAALLVSGCYDNNGERMVGDIDILIEKSRLNHAFALINESGYDKTFGFAYEKINYRHLDRLISSKELAAIELHEELLNIPYRSLLDAKTVLNNKIFSDGVAIPSSLHLNKHQILSWQVNDKGYYYNGVHFKSLYDVISLKTYKHEVMMSRLCQSKICQAYFEIANIYFNEFTLDSPNERVSIRGLSHKITMKYRLLRIVVRCLKSSFLFISTRIYLIKSNKNYRKHLYCKIFLQDKRRI